MSYYARQIVALGCAAAFLGLTMSAQAQPPASTPAPQLIIKGCTTFLQLGEVQSDIIAEIEQRLTMLKAEGITAWMQVSGLSPSEMTAEKISQVIAAQGDKPQSELMNFYSDAIDKVAEEVETRRKLLAMIDSEYRECLRSLPPSAALSPPAAKPAAVAAPPAAPKAAVAAPKVSAPVKRVVTVPREQNLRAATPPRSGHDPAASAIISGAIGGAIGGFSR